MDFGRDDVKDKFDFIPDRLSNLLKGAGKFTLEALNRPSQASAGFFSGSNPKQSISQAYKGFTGQEDYSFRDIGFVRNMSDEDVVGSLSPRDIAGGVASVGLDPLNLAFGLGVGSKAVRGIPYAGKALSAVLDPVSKSPNALKRVGAEMAVSGAATGTAELANNAVADTDLPDGAKQAIGLVAGFAGGAAAAKKTAGVNVTDRFKIEAPTASSYADDFEDIILEHSGHTPLEDQGILNDPIYGPDSKQSPGKDMTQHSGQLVPLRYLIGDAAEGIPSRVNKFKNAKLVANDVPNQVKRLHDEIMKQVSPTREAYDAKLIDRGFSEEERRQILDIVYRWYVNAAEARSSTSLSQGGIELLYKAFAPERAEINKLAGADGTITMYRGENVRYDNSKRIGAPYDYRMEGNMGLNEPQSHSQGYTTDPRVALSFAKRLSSSTSDGSYVIARRVPVSDIVSYVPHESGEYEFIILDEGALETANPGLFKDLTGREPDPLLPRIKPFKESDITRFEAKQMQGPPEAGSYDKYGGLVPGKNSDDVYSYGVNELAEVYGTDIHNATILKELLEETNFLPKDLLEEIVKYDANAYIDDVKLAIKNHLEKGMAQQVFKPYKSMYPDVKFDPNTLDTPVTLLFGENSAEFWSNKHKLDNSSAFLMREVVAEVSQELPLTTEGEILSMVKAYAPLDKYHITHTNGQSMFDLDQAAIDVVADLKKIYGPNGDFSTQSLPYKNYTEYAKATEFTPPNLRQVISEDGHTVGEVLDAVEKYQLLPFDEQLLFDTVMRGDYAADTYAYVIKNNPTSFIYPEDLEKVVNDLKNWEKGGVLENYSVTGASANIGVGFADETPKYIKHVIESRNLPVPPRIVDIDTEIRYTDDGVEQVADIPEPEVSAVVDELHQSFLTHKSLRNDELKDLAESYGLGRAGTRSQLFKKIGDYELRQGLIHRFDLQDEAPRGSRVTSTDMSPSARKAATEDFAEKVEGKPRTRPTGGSGGGGKEPPIVTGSSGLPDDINKYAEAKRKDLESRHPDLYTQFNTALKNLWASADASWIGIQGLLVIPRWISGGEAGNIVELMKVTGGSVFGGKENFNTWVTTFDKRARTSGAPTVAQWLEAGAHMSTFGDLADVGGITIANKIPGVGAVTQASNTLFANMGDAARLMSYQMEWLRHGKTADLAAITKAVNRGTGVAEKAFLGSFGQATMFAPKFLQSQLEMAAHFFEIGTIEGDIARKQIISMLGIGTMLTVGLNETLRETGQGGLPPEEYLDPTSSNFMRIRVAGNDISLFGPWDSMVKGFIRTAQDPKEGLIYMARSKAAPPIAIAWDVLTGKNFIGEKLDNPGTFAKSLLLPFAYQDVTTEPETWATALFSVGGIKASPLSSLELIKSSMKDEGKSYDDPFERRQWLIDHPNDVPKSTKEDQLLADDIRGNIKERSLMNEASTMLDAQTLVDYRENRRILQRELRNRLDTIFTDLKGRSPKNQQESWVKSYMELFEQAKNPVSGDVDGTLMDKLQSDWTERNGQEAMAYMNKFNLVGKPQLEERYLKDIQELNKYGYFDMPRLKGMKSGLDEDVILDLRGAVSTARLSDKRLAKLEYPAAVRRYLRQQGYDGKVILDVINAGSSKYENPAVAKFKKDHPHLVAWFNPNAKWSTYKELGGSI